MEEGGWQVPVEEEEGGWRVYTSGGGGGRLASTGEELGGELCFHPHCALVTVSILIVLWSLVVVVLVHYWCRFVWLVVLVVVLFLFEVVSVDDVHVAVECLGLLHHCNVHV